MKEEIDEGFNLSPKSVVEDKKTLCILDSDHIMYIVGPNKKLYKSNGQPKLDADGNQLVENKTLEETLKLADQYIKGVFARVGADYYIGFMTTGRNFRYEVYPAYKGNRKDVIKPPFYNEIKEYLMTKYSLTDYVGLEADDLVMIARKHYCDKYRCVIATTDKDILQMPYETFDPKKGNKLHTSKEDAYKFFWRSMIVGKYYCPKLFNSVKPKHEICRQYRAKLLTIKLIEGVETISVRESTLLTVS